VIYGGLGDDFLHGGAGDDAMSGAEALVEYYEAPDNPGNLLRWGEDREGEFAAYDEFDPLRKILVDATGAHTLDPTGREFLLNFDAQDASTANLAAAGTLIDGVTPVYSDGKDRLFGDLGNDWLVGGTDTDHLFGGRGDDLLNIDDDHDSTSGDADPRANNVPDTSVLFEDIAYGGAGRDILIGNTGGDRMIDWAGEFNSYLVPFAPFGAFTISRSLQPQLKEYLYDLSEGDGADPTRAGDTGDAVERNGEPNGEIGLVEQQDPDWGDQTGAPQDIQPGNIPGGARDVLRGADFNQGGGPGGNNNNGQVHGFAADSGSWVVENGRLEIAPELLGGDAASVFYVDNVLPSYFEIEAVINGGKPIAGYKSNAYIIFDYQGPQDFKFAGVNISIDKLQMGRRTAEGWIVDEQTPVQLRPDQDYHVLLALNGTVATLVIDGSEVFSHVYAPRVDAYGVRHGLNAGFVGLGAENSKARIDNVFVQVLPPEITLQETETFSDGVADRFTLGAVGDWQAAGGYFHGAPAAGQSRATTAVALDIRAAYLLRLQATLNTDTIAGVFFDQYSADDFKFVALSAETDEVIVGHHTARHGWAIDAVASASIVAGQDYDLEVTLKGTTISVLLDGQAVLGYSFNGLVVDGDFGLYVEGGSASFDAFTILTDDPAFTKVAGFRRTMDFSAGSVNLFTAASGDWQGVNDRYEATPDLGADKALSLVNLGFADGLDPAAELRILATLQSETMGGVVFDVSSPEDFRFAALLAQADQVVLGHHTAADGWVFDQVMSWVVEPGFDYLLEVVIYNTIATVKVDGVTTVSHDYYALLGQGSFGLLAGVGGASFGEVTISSDDSSLRGRRYGGRNADSGDGNDAVQQEPDAPTTDGLTQYASQDPLTAETLRVNDRTAEPGAALQPSSSGTTSSPLQASVNLDPVAVATRPAPAPALEPIPASPTAPWSSPTQPALPQPVVLLPASLHVTQTPSVSPLTNPAPEQGSGVLAPSDSAVPALEPASVLHPVSGVLTPDWAGLGRFWAATLDHAAFAWERAAAPRGAEDSRMAAGEDDEDETAPPQSVLKLGGWLAVEVGTRLDTQPRGEGSS